MLDLSSAFDRVDHDIKLSLLGPEILLLPVCQIFFGLVEFFSSLPHFHVVSILSPLLFSSYMLYLGLITCSYNTWYFGLSHLTICCLQLIYNPVTKLLTEEKRMCFEHMLPSGHLVWVKPLWDHQMSASEKCCVRIRPKAPTTPFQWWPLILCRVEGGWSWSWSLVAQVTCLLP